MDKIDIMKRLILISIILLVLASCKKEKELEEIYNEPGYAIGCAITKNLVNLNLLLPLLGAGTSFIVGGVICEIVSNSKMQKGVLAYNNTIKQKNNTSLYLGFAPTGMTLKLNL